MISKDIGRCKCQRYKLPFFPLFFQEIRTPTELTGQENGALRHKNIFLDKPETSEQRDRSVTSGQKTSEGTVAVTVKK